MNEREVLALMLKLEPQVRRLIRDFPGHCKTEGCIICPVKATLRELDKARATLAVDATER